jgi:ferric-dicitrate binding protein FerR (iron transport regulator)
MMLSSASKLLPALVALAAVLASPVHAAVPVGSTVIVVRTVTGTLGEDVRTLVVQDRVSQNEIIATKSDAASQIVFEDSTTLTLGPNAQVTLDKFVYDPNPSKGQFFLTITQGLMRFITGTLDHSAYTIKTPNGTIGVRGTNIYAAVSCAGAVCSTSLGSLQGTAVFTDKDGTQTVIGPGGFANFGGGAAGGSTGGGADLKAGILAGLGAALDQVAFAQVGLGGAFGGGGNSNNNNNNNNNSAGGAAGNFTSAEIKLGP